MRSIRIALTAVVLAAAGTVVAAGPAAADHIVVVSSSCSAGIFTGSFPGDVSTDTVRVHHRKNGTIEASCHFRGFPESVYLEEVSVLWKRPTVATVSDITGCVLLGDLAPGGEDLYGDGTLKLTPAGTGKVECRFTLP